jgi:hypothetical protein
VEINRIPVVSRSSIASFTLSIQISIFRAFDLRGQERVGLISVDGVLDVSDFIPEQIIGRAKSHA